MHDDALGPAPLDPRCAMKREGSLLRDDLGSSPAVVRRFTTRSTIVAAPSGESNLEKRDIQGS